MRKVLALLLLAILFPAINWAQQQQATKTLTITVNTGGCSGASPTWSSTPDQTSTQNCINSAQAGDQINIACGNGSWTSLVLAKALTLNGSGVCTVVDLGTHSQAVHITKQTGGITRITNMKFTATNNKSVPQAIVVDGPWPSGQGVVFQHITFTLATADLFDAVTPGGVIFSDIIYNGTWGDNFFTCKSPGDATSWHTADTLGARDTTGFANHYLENITFNGGNMTDADDACRIVVRHNTCNTCLGFNSHGDDTSPQGLRHFEIYENNFFFTDAPCSIVPNTKCPSNINQWVWIRGGSGVIYNNHFDPLVSASWGTKTVFLLNNRGREDNLTPKPGTTCGSATYPAPHQIGQNNNGSSDFTDPITFWGNTSNNSTLMHGFHLNLVSGWNWGNPCNFNWNTYWQWGRDGVNTSLTLPITANPGTGSTGGVTVEGIGGTPKAGYTAKTYPHPALI